MSEETLIRVSGDDSFEFGMDSYSKPDKLAPNYYVSAMNVINRGGIVQTRPGSSPISAIIPTGEQATPQGITFFHPTGAPNPALVFVISGRAFFSYPPFNTATFIPNIAFSQNSKYIAWAHCVQSTTYNAQGEIEFLDSPRAVLVMQDGNTRAAFWDGANSGHLNPDQSLGNTTQSGFDETPVGLWMSWSNNRLWVSSGNKIYASDYGNPLKFFDQRYINEGRAFYLKSNCTGIVESADRSGIICFSSDSADFIKSSIQDRTIWLSTPEFQQTILSGIGCISPRSIVLQYGMLWWNSARGLINLNDAERLYVTSKIDARDREMFQSKYFQGDDLSMVCGSSYENFLLQAVPYCSKNNSRIHVLDQSPTGDNAQEVWAGFWTGWNPVEFARGIIDGHEMLYTISHDNDNGVRIWKLFDGNKLDNGIPITSYVEFRRHMFDSRDYKKFKHAEIELQNIIGDVAVAAFVRGTRGAYQKVCTKDISATNGQLYYDQEYGYDSNDFAGSRSQTRIIKTTDTPDPSDCNAECIETDKMGLIDKGFSLMVAWSGIAGISAYRIFSVLEPEAISGTCEDDESGNRLITPEGCGESGLFSSKLPYDTYYSDATFSRTVDSIPAPFQTITSSATRSSIISQKDADRKAMAAARGYVDATIQAFSQIT